MDATALLLMIAAIILPVTAILLFGDRILVTLDAGRRKSKRSRRRRGTRALPVRDEVIRVLLKAEERRDGLDSDIERALDKYGELSRASRSPDSMTAALEATERALLIRESHFNTYIDLAWLQSETIETLMKEVKQLMEFAELGDFDFDAAVPRPEKATEKLMKSLETAASKRKAVDDQLKAIGLGGEEPREG